MIKLNKGFIMSMVRNQLEFRIDIHRGADFR